MHTSSRTNTIATGLAMFSMFFGAGNVVFPIALGQYAQDYNFYAILGLLITAVGVPFTGLIAMSLYDGEYHRFFERTGKVPGFLLALFIMALIGPFGAIPRCITLSYATVKMFIPNVSLPIFSFISCAIIFLLTFRRKSILDILGYVLTPILLVSLVIMIIKGILTSPEMGHAEHSISNIFIYALQEGYQTMDLLGALFFSSIVLLSLKKGIHPSDQNDYKKLIIMAIKASFIGAGLLALVYTGFSYSAAFHSDALVGISKAEKVGALARHILGDYAGLVASVAVALACLTTAIALASVFAEYLHEDIAFEKIGYIPMLVITLALTFLVSILGFTGIADFIGPIMVLCYPALIVLSFVNILHKLYGFKPVKIPVLITFIITLIGYFVW